MPGEPVLIVVDEANADQVTRRRDPLTEAVLPVSDSPTGTDLRALVHAFGSAGPGVAVDPNKARYRHVCVVAQPQNEPGLIGFVAAALPSLAELGWLFTGQVPHRKDHDKPVEPQRADAEAALVTLPPIPRPRRRP